ncbi:MAG: hypothetical protein NTW59_03745 [Candidatus Diapherotrites archaeon]|nr:hypothetical protein [Candidatus Diapherotrites archaeon]
MAIAAAWFQSCLSVVFCRRRLFLWSFSRTLAFRGSGGVISISLEHVFLPAQAVFSLFFLNVGV